MEIPSNSDELHLQDPTSENLDVPVTDSETPENISCVAVEVNTNTHQSSDTSTPSEEIPSNVSVQVSSELEDVRPLDSPVLSPRSRFSLAPVEDHETVSNVEEVHINARQSSDISTPSEQISPTISVQVSSEETCISPSKLKDVRPLDNPILSPRSRFSLAPIEDRASTVSNVVAEVHTNEHKSTDASVREPQQSGRRNVPGDEIILVDGRITQTVEEPQQPVNRNVLEDEIIVVEERIIASGTPPPYVILGQINSDMNVESEDFLASEVRIHDSQDIGVEERLGNIIEVEHACKNFIQTSERSFPSQKIKRRNSDEIYSGHENESNESSISVMQTDAALPDSQSQTVSPKCNTDLSLEAICNDVQELAEDIKSAVSQLSITLQKMISFHPDRRTGKHLMNATPLRLETLARQVPQTLHNVKTSARLVTQAPVIFKENKANAVAACRSMLMICDELYKERDDFKDLISTFKNTPREVPLAEVSFVPQSEGDIIAQMEEKLVNSFGSLDVVLKSFRSKISALEKMEVLAGDVTEPELDQYETAHPLPPAPELEKNFGIPPPQKSFLSRHKHKFYCGATLIISIISAVILYLISNVSRQIERLKKAGN